MDKKKPIGYTKEETSSMKKLIERTEPKSGDYVGSGTVTEVPKKKKKMKRMQMGGMAGRAAMYGRGRGPMSDMMTRPGFPVRGGGGVPLQGPGGVMVRPERPSIKGKSMRDLRAGVGPFSLMDRVKAARGMKGGGLARKGIGMALAKGGLVKANGCAQRGKTKGKIV